jgi:hypothetical protein
MNAIGRKNMDNPRKPADTLKRQVSAKVYMVKIDPDLISM